MAARRIPITTTMSAEPGRGAGALYRLLAWLSPSFPVGAFSYSHGLETAAASGAWHDGASLEAWIAATVARGSGRVDADILCQAYRAARAGDEAGIDAANRRGLAFRATAELALEAAQQGEAFLSTCLAAWPEPFLEDWAAPPPHPLPPGGGGGKETGGGGGGAFPCGCFQNPRLRRAGGARRARPARGPPRFFA